MRHPMFWFVVGTFFALTGCVASVDDTPTIISTPATMGTTTPTETIEECRTGFKIGRCPRDFSLPNGDGDIVTLHEHRGSRVAVVGSAMY